MSYSSADEGEIRDSDGEKATKTRPQTRDMAIDRKSRPRSPLSRSPRPLQRQLDGADDSLDYGDDDGRVASAYQAHTSQGQKRRREDDHHSSRTHDDPRRFQVRYEPSERPGDDRRHAQRSDRKPPYPLPTRQGRYDDRAPPPGKRYQSDRHRPRSRSPPGSSRNNQPGRAHQHYARASEDMARSRRSSTHSAADADRESIPPPSDLHRTRAEPPSASRQGQSSTTSTPQDDHDDNDAEPVVIDEAALIEQRRKRREALRAKHRGQNTPLLHKALEANAASQPATPPPSSANHADTSSRSDDSSRATSVDLTSAATSTVESPSTSNPSSPAAFSVANDEELANRTQASPDSRQEVEGASAADYDPAMDVEEIKLREQRANRHLESSGDYDETKDHDDGTTRADPVSQPKGPKEFDMFADDDDDDMFAPEPANGHRKDDGTQAVRLPEAKQLDRSLLDDWDDPEGYYRIILGELLDGRYHVQTNLGKGVFSAVVRALDTATERLVAIKIIRKQESMYKAGMKEIETLQKLAEADPEDKKHLIRLERHFEHKGHLCMVFENLSINLREVLKKFGRDIGINIKAVRSYAQQMFLGLSLLRKCEILHADLKPDNVLVNENRSQLKIADLGSAVSASDNEVTDALVSRFYRAPEIMLGIRHDYAIDMWSIGCTLFELYTGKICFTGPTNNQMLRAIMECRGKIPNRMLKKAEFWAQHFDPDGTFLSQEADPVSRKEVVRRQNIVRPIPSKELKARLFNSAKGLSPADAKELNLFADLLDRCLAVDPARRITPTDALKHGFITRQGLQSR